MRIFLYKIFLPDKYISGRLSFNLKLLDILFKFTPIKIKIKKIIKKFISFKLKKENLIVLKKIQNKLIKKIEI